MKIKLFAATAVLALGLAACGGETPAPETPAPEAPAAEAPAPEPVPATASIGETPADPVAFMKTRHDNYEDLGKNFKVLLDNSKLGTPDMAAVAAAAAKVNEYAGQMGTWFPPGTGPEAGKLVTAAGTDAAAFKAQFGPTGGTCKACHDTYREEDKDK